MDYVIVVESFGRFGRGDAIRDHDEIAAALAEHADKVVRVTASIEPPSGDTE